VAHEEVREDTLEQIVQLVRKLSNVLEGGSGCHGVHGDGSEGDDDCTDVDDGGGGAVVGGGEIALILYFD